MVLCIHHLLTLLCMCVCAHTLSSNLYLHPTQPVCCYLCIFQPPRQHTFITAPDSGIGNLSLILISLKLQFTWIFVGVLRANCSLADGPGTLALVLSLSLFLPAPEAGRKCFHPTTKPQSDFSIWHQQTCHAGSSAKALLFLFLIIKTKAAGALWR